MLLMFSIGYSEVISGHVVFFQYPSPYQNMLWELYYVGDRMSHNVLLNAFLNKWPESLITQYKQLEFIFKNLPFFWKAGSDVTGS